MTPFFLQPSELLPESLKSRWRHCCLEQFDAHACEHGSTVRGRSRYIESGKCSDSSRKLSSRGGSGSCLTSAHARAPMLRRMRARHWFARERGDAASWNSHSVNTGLWYSASGRTCSRTHDSLRKVGLTSTRSLVSRSIPAVAAWSTEERLL